MYIHVYVYALNVSQRGVKKGGFSNNHIMITHDNDGNRGIPPLGGYNIGV